MEERIDPPLGYNSWLDCAVANIDTRRIMLDVIADGRDIDRNSIIEAIVDELRNLRLEQVSLMIAQKAAWRDAVLPPGSPDPVREDSVTSGGKKP